ncbi:MAG: TraR/DksA C4-type zinc finger protein [Candidatus Ancaeobacter aquaticus]|nr:TraR/DksA C4-type zinc finger protein [Candidatus Ancaeobacter aquaticus]
MNKRDMKKYKEKLLDKKEQIVRSLKQIEDETLNKSQRDQSGDLSAYSLHMADVGTDNFDREFALGLMSNEQNILYEIDEAMQRMENGSYGKCETCECDISEKRLEALPSASNCRACQEKVEKKGPKA